MKAVPNCPRCGREFAQADMEPFVFAPGTVHRGKDGVTYPMAGKRGVLHRPCGYEMATCEMTMEYETLPEE